VEDRGFEEMLCGLLQVDFSAGTEAFREALLARCLSELDACSGDEVAELDDADLGMLAAAGDAMRADGPPLPGSCGMRPQPRPGQGT